MQIYFSDPLFFCPLCLQILKGHFDTDSNSFTDMMNASRPGALLCKRNLSSSSRHWLTRWVQSAWNSMLMEVSSLLAARTLISFEIRLILSRIEMILPGMIVSIRSSSEILSDLIFTFITVLRICKHCLHTKSGCSHFLSLWRSWRPNCWPLIAARPDQFHPEAFIWGTRIKLSW